MPNSIDGHVMQHLHTDQNPFLLSGLEVIEIMREFKWPFLRGQWRMFGKYLLRQDPESQENQQAFLKR